jgi:hypothetical protein
MDIPKPGPLRRLAARAALAGNLGWSLDHDRRMVNQAGMSIHDWECTRLNLCHARTVRLDRLLGRLPSGYEPEGVGGDCRRPQDQETGPVGDLVGVTRHVVDSLMADRTLAFRRLPDSKHGAVSGVG